LFGIVLRVYGWRSAPFAATLLTLAACGIVKEQPPAAVPADHFAAATLLSEQPAGRTSVPADQRRFTTPHLAFDVEWTVVAGELTMRAFGLSGRSRAAPGQELVAVGFGNPVESPYEEDKKEPVTVTVLAGERETKLDRTTMPFSGGGLLVSVQAGAPVTLQVADAGRTFTYDLRAGKRGPDAVALFQQPGRRGKIDGSYTGTGRLTYRSDARSLKVDISFRGWYLTPWLPSSGWAADGRAWLLLTVGITTDGLSYDIRKREFPIKIFVETAATFAIAGADGVTYRPVARSINASTVSIADHSVVTDVPATFAGASVTVTPAGPITALYKEVQPKLGWATAPPPGTFAFTRP
jgi:hypothetical protein